MNIQSTTNNISFGKISWGTAEKARKTEAALITLKEANDIDGINLLKFNDVVEQLKILSDNPDTFEVGCSIVEGYHDASFDINVFELKTRELIGSFSEYFTADYKKNGVKKPQKKGINFFAENVLNNHKKNEIKTEVSNLMSNLGKVNS